MTTKAWVWFLLLCTVTSIGAGFLGGIGFKGGELVKLRIEVGGQLQEGLGYKAAFEAVTAQRED